MYFDTRELPARDAYKLLTSKGLRPAVVPKSGGFGMMKLPFTRDKNKTVAPPKADTGAAWGRPLESQGPAQMPERCSDRKSPSPSIWISTAFEPPPATTHEPA